MEIRLDSTNTIDLYGLADIIHTEFNSMSRFNVEITKVIPRKRTPGSIFIGKVRLKEKKHWCGSHPFACEIGQSRMSTLLEGADWVEFNDRLNDILDRYNISAKVESAVCIIRKGRERRVHYDGHDASTDYITQYEWNKDEDEHAFIDYCGRIAPASWYPPGTPGLYERESIDA